MRTLTCKERIDTIQSMQAAFETRCDTLRQAKDAWAISELRSICPELPASPAAFHLAHNWLVCTGNRQARWIVTQRNEYGYKLSSLKQSYWLSIYNRIYKASL